MKTLLLSLIVICLFLGNASAQEKTDFETLNIKGAVRKVETYYLIPPATGEKGAATRQISTTMLFNRNGQITEHLRYSTPPDRPTKEVHIYDRNGHRILYENYGGFHRNERTKAWERSDEFVYKYDKAGRIIEQLELNKPSKTVMRRIVLRYDDRGNVIEKLHFGFRGDKLSERNAYTFDSRGRKTSDSKVDGNGALILKSTLVYNSKGLVVERIAEGKDLSGVERTTYDYDDRNRTILLRIESSQPSGKQSIHKTEFSYDDVLSTREERQYGGEVLMITTRYKLDKYENILAKMESFSDEAKKILAGVAAQPSSGLIPIELGAALALSGMFQREAFSYEYDKHGNWIKRVEHEATEFVIGSDNSDAELKPVRTQFRKIEYYDR